MVTNILRMNACTTGGFAPFLNGRTWNQTQQFGSNGLELRCDFDIFIHLPQCKL